MINTKQSYIECYGQTNEVYFFISFLNGDDKEFTFNLSSFWEWITNEDHHYYEYSTGIAPSEIQEYSGHYDSIQEFFFKDIERFLEYALIYNKILEYSPKLMQELKKSLNYHKNKGNSYYKVLEQLIQESTNIDNT